MPARVFASYNVLDNLLDYITLGFSGRAIVLGLGTCLSTDSLVSGTLGGGFPTLCPLPPSKQMESKTGLLNISMCLKSCTSISAA